jgi:multidrug transporter EmrE-like cation transporter
MWSYVYILIGVSLCIVGEILSKQWANGRQTLWIACACILVYGSSVIPWLLALSMRNRLIIVFMLWAILQACAAVMVGLWYGESMGWQQWLGVGLGILSVSLLCI